MEILDKQLEEFEALLNRKGYDDKFETIAIQPGSFSEVMKTLMNKFSRHPTKEYFPQRIFTSLQEKDHNGHHTLGGLKIQYNAEKGFDVIGLEVYRFEEGCITKDYKKLFKSAEQLPSCSQAIAHMELKTMLSENILTQISELEKVLREKSIDVMFYDARYGTLFKAVEGHIKKSSSDSFFPHSLTCSIEEGSIDHSVHSVMYLDLDISATGKLLTPEATIIQNDNNFNELDRRTLKLNSAKDLPLRHELQKIFINTPKITKTNKKRLKL